MEAGPADHLGRPHGRRQVLDRQNALSRLDLPFVDTDEEVEHEAGQTVVQLFEQLGEAEFRARERRSLARVLASPQACVVATGGGAFTHPDSRKQILERCLVIWLDADPETLAWRLSADGDRLLLKGRPSLDVLQELALERNPAYAEAHLRFDSTAEASELLVDRIAAAITCWRPSGTRGA